MKIRILLVDDHAILREGLRILLESQNVFQVVGEASDGMSAIQLAVDLAPDVVIMDISMPGMYGVEATRRIVAKCPDTRVIALSMHSTRNFVSEMLKAGACGYLLKRATGSELVTAIQIVMKGQVYLSPDVAGTFVEVLIRDKPTETKSALSELTAREREVLRLVAEGRTTKEIATLLRVTAKTIDSHRAQIMDKLGIHGIAGLTKLALHEGLISSEP